jgi:hypothetical protein
MTTPTAGSSGSVLGLEPTAHVPASLPPTMPSPEPASDTGLLQTVMLFWCRPRRYGPRLAAAPFRLALGAQMLAILVAVGVVATAILWRLADPVEGLAKFHRALAQEILDRASSSAGKEPNWLLVIEALGIVPFGALGLAALGAFVMPFGACGDQASSVWKRGVKSAYWSTTAIIPVSVLLGVAILAFVPSFQQRTAHLVSSKLMLLGSVAGVILLAHMGLATALAVSRYVGPPDDPVFAPREPCCDDCGYLIIGLPLDSRCPECGTPVRESLPDGRRRQTAWQQHQFELRGFVDLLRTHWAVLRSSAFFRRLPVHSGLPAARHYWCVSWAFFVACGLTILGVAALSMRDNLPIRASRSQTWLYPPDDSEMEASIGPAVILLIIAPLAFQSIVMFASCLWAQLRYSIRDYRVSAIVCYYAAPLFWPLAITLLAASILAFRPATTELDHVPLTVFRGFQVTALHVAGAAVLLAGIAALAFWWLRLLKALWSVRFANV